MRLPLILLLPLLLLAPCAVAQAPQAGGQAQEAQATAPTTPPAATEPTTEEKGKKDADDWRDTRGYRFPAIAKTVEDLQYLAYAMQLREYCANRRVSDDFVRERLKRFSAMTGREESCRTLLDY